MTLTNHIQRIEELAGRVREHTDKREYEMAHSVLVSIEICVQSLKRHIDKLQSIADRAARPAWEG